MNLRSDLPMIAVMGVIGFAAGFIFSPGLAGAVPGLLVGAGLGVVMARAGMRPVIGPTIAAGAVMGGWIGREIVRALCLPGSCPGVEVGGALFTGIGAMFGIGLVIALVVRSFDEYREGRGPQAP